MGRVISRAVHWFRRTFAVLLERLADVTVIQSGVLLAAHTFLALLPLLIIVVAFFPPTVGEAIATTLRDRFGLVGQTNQVMHSVINGRNSLRGGISVFGAIVALASATSFTRALQRVYERSWGLPHLGLRGSFQGLVWLVGLVGFVSITATAVHFAGGTPVAGLARLILLVVGSFVLWWITPYVLLTGRVRLRALLPGGLVTGFAMIVLGEVSRIVVPRTVASNERQFGTIGVIFAIESWLVVVGCTLVAAAVIGSVLAQGSGRVGQLARGTHDLDGWRRARPR